MPCSELHRRGGVKVLCPKIVRISTGEPPRARCCVEWPAHSGIRQSKNLIHNVADRRTAVVAHKSVATMSGAAREPQGSLVPVKRSGWAGQATPARRVGPFAAPSHVADAVVGEAEHQWWRVQPRGISASLR